MNTDLLVQFLKAFSRNLLWTTKFLLFCSALVCLGIGIAVLPGVWRIIAFALLLAVICAWGAWKEVRSK